MFSSLLEKIFKTNQDDNISSEKETISEVVTQTQEKSSNGSSKKVSVILEEAKFNRALVAKDIRELTGVGFQESYDILDRQNFKIKENLDLEEAKAIKSKLENLNAKVKLS